MKNSQKLFSLAMLVCLTVAMFSCSKDEEEGVDIAAGIVGQWEIESTELLLAGTPVESYIEQTAQQSGLPVETIKATLGDALDLDLQGNFHFTEDNKFTGTLGKEEMEGTWATEGQNLILTDSKGVEQKFVVKSLKEDSAMLSQTSTQGDGATAVESEVILHIKSK